MPLTPFHFGPGLLLKAIFEKSFWFSSFVLANVLIDLEVLHNLAYGRLPLHGILHTYLAGTVIGLFSGVMMAVIGLGLAQVVSLRIFRLHQLLRQSWKRTLLLSMIGGLAGGISHILLDSLMHRDMQPFWPLQFANTLAGSVGVGALHAVLALMGLLGGVLLLFSYAPQNSEVFDDASLPINDE